MSRRLRAHLRANVVGYVAVFLALGGTAWAAGTIGTRDVVNDSLKSVDLKDNAAVGSQDVIDGSLTGDDVDEGSLGVPAMGCQPGLVRGVAYVAFNVPNAYTDVPGFSCGAAVRAEIV